ncbi:MAG TPA: discoidin domain-containing protein [Pyrinomonadaceae bacterium]|jgi:RHS repeat-associated protein|nr:discoidin domain-containing protein [Pyrinomonadaceae bacterium]
MNTKKGSQRTTLQKAHLCRRRRILFLILTFLIGLLRVEAQNSSANGVPAESKPGQSTVSTYARDKIETVNLANGNFSMSIPLATIGGRGSAAFTLALTYNSKVWSSQLDPEPVFTGQGASGTPINHYSAMYEKIVDFDPYVTKLGGGWTILAGPGLKGKLIGIDHRPTSGCDNETDGIRDCGFRYALTKMWLTLPDGSQVELRDTLTEGAPSLTTQNVNGFYSLIDRDRGRVWHSVDGSNITFIRDQNDPPQAETFYPSGWVFLADGTRLRMDSGICSKIIDSNGNFITLAGGTYTDQLSRQTTLQVTENTATITVKGYMGLPDRLITIDLSALGNVENLRADFQALPRPFTTGDALHDTLGNYFPHTIQGAHTDLFIESEGVKAYGATDGDDVGLRKAVTKLNLPDGRSMRFRYNQYGEVAEIVYPAGGISQIDYEGGVTSICEVSAPMHLTLNRRVSQRRSLTNAADVDATWIYSEGGEVINGINRPSRTVESHQGSATGPLLSSEKHAFLAVNSEYRTCQSPLLTGTGNEKWENAKEFRTEIQTGTGTITTERQWQQRAPLVWANDVGLSYNDYVVNRGQDQAPNDPRVEWEETTLENGTTKRIEYGYDNFNNVTSIKEYDFGTPGSPGTLLQQTVRQYAGNAPTLAINSYCYTNLNPVDSSCASGLASDPAKIIHQRHVLLSETIKDGGGNQKAYTEYEYDNYASEANHAELVANSGMIQYDGSQFSIFASSYQPRGNVTRTTHWAGASNYIYSFAQYNNAGAVIWSKDPNGNISTVSYTDNFGAGSNPDAGSAGPFGPTYAMATATSNALGHQTKIQFDYSHGVPTGVKDANGVIAKTEYDLLGRPTRSISALGLTEQAIAEISYPTASANFTTTSTQLDASRWLASKQVMDGFDRVVTSWLAEDGQHASVASYTIRTNTAYDGLGRAVSVSNPYRPATEVPQYTTTVYNIGGRVTSVTTPDNAVVSTSYNGNSVTVTDQAGKARKSVTDALGRLTEVYEDPSGLNYQTTYAYDTLDNLVKVTQGTQQRFFMYDSLKRLIRARNPEQSTLGSLAISDPTTGNSAWSTAYEYDTNGNLTKKTDTRGVESTYVYDALNRNTSVNYSNTTIGNPDVPDITRFYDGATNGKGRFWYSYKAGNLSVGDNVEHTAIDSYDALGRPLVQRQLSKFSGTWSPTYQISRAYNRAGAVTSQTYPSLHTVTYSYDSAGRTSSFAGNLGDGNSRTYSNITSYSPFGGLTREQFGTTNAVYNKLHYNVRGQLFDVRVSNVSDAIDEWGGELGALVNYYSTPASHGGSGPDNNGNVLMSRTIVNSYYMEDRYSYDALNRLADVSEWQNGLTNTGRQQYDYDRWGNRTINAAQTWGTGINNKQFAVDTATNRLGVPNGQSGTMTYDAAGNLINDTYTGAGSRDYDAENKMTRAWGGNNQWQEYTYNADGQRVRRKIDGQETWQIYGMDGELLAEYSANGPAASPQKEYGYRNGQLLITAEPPSASSPSGPNFAAASNGALASASSTYPGVVAGNAINGDHVGNASWWADDTSSAYPDWIQVDFSSSKTISEIDVFGVQQNPSSPIEPTATMTSSYALTDFQVQYWNGSAWATVSGGSISGSEKVWRKFTFAPLTTSKIRVYVTNVAGDNHSQVVEIEAYGPVNVAAASNGAVSTASSTYPGVVAGNAINGDHVGSSSWWADNTSSAYPDWIQVDFSSSKTIGEIDVFGVQQNPGSPVEPTATMTSSYALTNFEVQYWTGSAWATVPGASVSGNDKVWRKFTFAPLTTSKVRVYVTNVAGDNHSQVVEIEAYTPSTNATIQWLVTDHLGTPRIIVDQTGNLANIKRHDYLPFGEELFAGTGGRTTALGYAWSDGVRQQFTLKERDVETGLDYFFARYYSSTQARFVSVDPLMKSASIGDPQSFNRYTYVLNNPVTLDDRDGLCPKGMKCYHDKNGYEYYVDADGNEIYLTDTTAKKLVVPPTLSVIRAPAVSSPYEIVFRSTRIIKTTPKVAPTASPGGLGFFGRLFGAFGIILFNPTSTGCGASPGMVSDGSGGCMYMTAEDEPDTSANPDPEDNKPDMSENKTEEKKGSKEKPVRDIIPAGLKRSKSYHSELQDLTVSELQNLARKRGEKGQRAKRMLKLAKQQRRLKGKGY